MSRNYSFYVYILTNQQKSVLYTGVTNKLFDRIIAHWEGRGEPQTFTGRYRVHFLLYYETHGHIGEAIAREKEIKGWIRRKKCDLISGFNPDWKFLNEELFGAWPPAVKR